MPDLVALGHTLSVWFLPVVIAITMHEAAHAWAADKLGDSTAKSLGRLSFNPIRHVDPFGTFVLPATLLYIAFRLGVDPIVIGWAKPVPVAFHRLHNPKKDMIWVALAGPAINIILAILCLFTLHLVGQLLDGTLSRWLWENLWNAVSINVILASFNMLPILPLDGGRVLVGILPIELARRYARTERFGLIFVLGLFLLLPYLLGEFGIEFSPLENILGPIANFVFRFLQIVTGWGG